MNRRTQLLIRWTLSMAMAAALLALAPVARAAEAALFVSGAGPAEAWNRGLGGSFGITLFDLVHGELEVVSQGSEIPDTTLRSGSAKVALGPTFGRLVPYAGLGAGVYYWSGIDDDPAFSNYSLAFLGLKVRLPAAVFLRAEFQWVSLENDTALPIDHRLLIGAGLRF